ncbi:AI-2E family transporter [Dictyobacter formicarum]|uniref:AI-2E family transporter n=1 Tax=Dictyobacter formicarum TaxID=2778368 RepID=UPI0019161793|nr:AI-2E family transporter [Dictyobacter formicarum]
MARETRLLPETKKSDVQAAKWARRLYIPLALLAWIALAAVILWGASHIARALLLLIIAAILAYAIAPAVKLLERIMPRFAAIAIVYLVVLGAISTFTYFAIATTIHQAGSLSRELMDLLSPQKGHTTPLEQTLIHYGISADQIAEARRQLTTYIGEFSKQALPLLQSVLDFAIDIIVVAVLSIYLLIDGSRVAKWARNNTPTATRASFFLDTLQRVVGGYIRGQVTLAALIGILVWIGMLLLHVPYSVLLGVLAFAMAFVPVLGTLVSGAVCVLLALTQGWIIAMGVLVYFIVIHVIEGELVGPRIVGKAIGLHPVVSLFALIAGGELFGVWGALFASPLAGIIQALIITFWTEWRQSHPEQFQTEEEQLEDEVADVATEIDAHPTEDIEQPAR